MKNKILILQNFYDTGTKNNKAVKHTIIIKMIFKSSVKKIFGKIFGGKGFSLVFEKHNADL